MLETPPHVHFFEHVRFFLSAGVSEGERGCNAHGRDLDVYHSGAVRYPDAQSALRVSTSDSANTTSRAHWAHSTIRMKTL